MVSDKNCLFPFTLVSVLKLTAQKRGHDMAFRNRNTKESQLRRNEIEFIPGTDDEH